MSKLYPIILVLQVYCIYHAFQHRKPFYWFLLILFIPLAGSITYLYLNYDLTYETEDDKEPYPTDTGETYDADALMHNSNIADTITNRIRLGDANASKGNYKAAIALYESCLHSYNADDSKTKEKLMVAKYFIEDFQGVEAIGDELNSLPTFKNSESRIIYAWSVARLGHLSKAEELFKDMDGNFSNYIHRAEYAKFLIEQNRQNEARSLLEQLKDEIAHMEVEEKKRKDPIRREINQLLKSIS